MEIVVFTNGCFDILHLGHIQLLRKARSLGTKLIVGLNSDRSVKAIKGNSRPFLDQESRAEILRELNCVDEVKIFDDNTPEKLIKDIKPDILVKGGDWRPEEIIGSDFVLQRGGRVFSIPFEKDISTTQILEQFIERKSPMRCANPSVAVESFQAVTGKSKVYNHLENTITANKYLLDTQVSNIESAISIISQVLSSGGGVNCFYNGKIDTIDHVYKKLIEDQSHSDDNVRIEDLCEWTEKLKSTRHKNKQLLIFVGAHRYSKTEKERITAGLLSARNKDFRVIGLLELADKKIAGICDTSIFVPENNSKMQTYMYKLIFEQWLIAIPDLVNLV